MSEPNPDTYVSYREHAELRLRVGALEARLAHLPDQVEKLREEVRAIPGRIQAEAPNLTGTAMALHRALDALSAAPAKSSGGVLDQLIRLVGAIAIGALGYRFLGAGL